MSFYNFDGFRVVVGANGFTVECRVLDQAGSTVLDIRGAPVDFPTVFGALSPADRQELAEEIATRAIYKRARSIRP